MTHLIDQVYNLILYKMEQGELSFESVKALKSVFQEYENHTRVIEQQLEMCKRDHDQLRIEIANLLEENKNLSSQLKSYSENALCKEGKSNIIDSSDVVDNLRQQLALALEEKDTLEALWRSCLMEVDTLQEKLEQYRSGKQLTIVQSKLNDVQQDYSEAINLLESRLSHLKAENDQLAVKTQFLENQLMQITSQMSLMTEKNLTLSCTLKGVSAHEQEWKSKFLALEAKYIELDRLYQADKVKFAHMYEYEKVESHLKEKLEGALRQRDELQTALEQCHERMAELLRNAASDRSKIEEAVHLVEGALQDRDEALAREALSAEELKKLKTEMNNVVEEAGQRLVHEVASVKSQFENQLSALRDQLQIVEQERSRKCKEVEQWQEECKRLQAIQDQSHDLIQGGTDRQDKQLNHLYQELEFSERECLQLKIENEALHKTLAKLQDRYEKINREKMKLKRELQDVEKQSELYQHELAITTHRADLITDQLNQITLELTHLQSEKLLQRDNMVNAQAKFNVTNSIELYKRLDDSYSQMNNRWKKEMNDLTEKFEAKFKKLKVKNKSYIKGDTKDNSFG